MRVYNDIPAAKATALDRARWIAGTVEDRIRQHSEAALIFTAIADRHLREAEYLSSLPVVTGPLAEEAGA